MTYLPLLRRLSVVPDPPLDPPALSPREEVQAEEWGEELVIVKNLETAVIGIVDMLPEVDAFKYAHFLPMLDELQKVLEIDRQALEHKLQWGDD